MNRPFPLLVDFLSTGSADINRDEFQMEIVPGQSTRHFKEFHELPDRNRDIKKRALHRGLFMVAK